MTLAFVGIPVRTLLTGWGAEPHAIAEAERLVAAGARGSTATGG